MKIISLGIESSCDDTSASIVTSEKEILSNIVLSQINEHKIYKGVVPEIASRAHMNYLDFAIKEALKEANISLENVSCIAATGGPGLIGGVIVGTMFAKAIASSIKKPYIPINHLEGHALTARLCSDVEFPYLLLLVSGGHCQFVTALGPGKYVLLGETLDDAVGEAFDKLSKMLGMDYPGGPIIEKHALNGDEKKYSLPKSMCDRKGCDMSFSGLKTAAKLLIDNQTTISEQFKYDISASFQYTICKILEYKLSEAINLYEKFSSNKTVVIAGGVAANKYLISNLEAFLKNKDYKLISPPLNLCTDNAAMIAWAGIEKFNSIHNSDINNIEFCPRARWPLENLDNQ